MRDPQAQDAMENDSSSEGMPAGRRDGTTAVSTSAPSVRQTPRGSSATRKELPWAHPMGWRNALLLGIAYGGALAFVPYGAWCAITLGRPPGGVLFLIGFFGVIGFLIPLAIEADELSKVRKGLARDIRRSNA